LPKACNVLIWRSAAVPQTSHSIFNVLRLTLRAQPRSENFIVAS
jgi:hypothetical protein